MEILDEITLNPKYWTKNHLHCFFDKSGTRDKKDTRQVIHFSSVL